MRIQLNDLLEGVTPYEPHLMRLPPLSPAEMLPENRELVHAASKTAKDILSRQGLKDFIISDADAHTAATMFADSLVDPSAITSRKMQKPGTVLKLEAFLSEYDWRVVQHADQIRFLVTNKLIELADNKDPRVQLKAVELLGKTADVGMFVEKQEITYNQKSDAELKQQLKEKLGLLIEGELIPDTPDIEIKNENETLVTPTPIHKPAQKREANHVPLPEVPLPDVPVISEFILADLMASK